MILAEENTAQRRREQARLLVSLQVLVEQDRLLVSLQVEMARY